jgi:predicted P-loop ATPase
MELPELQGFSKAEVTTIKGFVSRQTDKVRLAFAHRAANYHRQCVFMGSTNNLEYLRDSSGGRRFWPIYCSVDEIDTKKLRRNVDQLWAEALFIYRQARIEQPFGDLPLYMTNPVAAKYALEIQESRRQESLEDVVSAQIEEWLDSPIGSELGLEKLEGEVDVYRNEICLLDIWVNMMGRDRHAYVDREQKMLGRAILEVKGWR